MEVICSPQSAFSSKSPEFLGKTTSRVQRAANNLTPVAAARRNVVLAASTSPYSIKTGVLPRPLSPFRSTTTSTAAPSADQLVINPSTLRPLVERPILSVAGGGGFFFWYLGVMKYIQENFALSRMDLHGASAGGLCVILAACNVDLDRAVREAYRLSVDNNIWTRPGGLAGIWGSLVRDWLDSLLPEDADERCRGKVRLVVTEALTLRLRYLEDFSSREDLIDAAMASVHIPFFLDGNATFTYRGQRFIDGSLWDFFSGSNSELLTLEGRACVIDYFWDDQLKYGRLDFMKLSSYDEVRALVRAGYAWAERTDAAGGFEAQLGSTRKGIFTRAVEFPGRQLSKVFSAA